MSFKRISLVSIIVLLTIVFSSCHEDDYYSWEKGILERNEQFYTDTYGEIRKSFTIDDRDIRVEGPSFMSIEDFRPRDGSETLLYVKNGGWIDELFLEVEGTRINAE